MRKLLRTIFLVDLVQGLMVTFRNQNPKNIVTEQYPAETPKIAERYRWRSAAEYQPGEWTNPLHCLRSLRAGVSREPDCGHE
ncbi:MAG: hypothetical protein QM757_15930 [Paludibaculum sp.]